MGAQTNPRVRLSSILLWQITVLCAVSESLPVCPYSEEVRLPMRHVAGRSVGHHVKMVVQLLLIRSEQGAVTWRQPAALRPMYRLAVYGQWPGALHSVLLSINVTDYTIWWLGEVFYNRFDLVITPTNTAQSGAFLFVSRKGTGITNVQTPVENGRRETTNGTDSTYRGR
jgi:hypothetical protein